VIDVDVYDRGLVVGLDGSRDSERAVAWAASEAVLRRRPVTLRYVADPFPFGRDVPYIKHDAAVASQWLSAEADKLRADHPDLPVLTEVSVGAPAEELLRHSSDADMLVVGSRGRGGFASLLLGSISHRLLAQAHCPVVVVPARSGPEDSPVVVGVDGSEVSSAALAFAVEEAEVRSVPVRVVHAWHSPPTYGGDFPTVIDVDEIEKVARRTLENAVEPYRGRQPGLVVDSWLVRGPAGPELIEASRDASLLVLGSHGHSGVVAGLLGSVSQWAVHHAHVPVAVLRGPAPSR
jgi:nucleotide-binding universal stress UspA family protein